jgi:hypothetical protein
MDCMLQLLLPARNKQIFARPRLNCLLRRISGKLKLNVLCSADTSHPTRKRRKRSRWGNTTLALTLTLLVILTLTLLLAFLSSQLPPSWRCRSFRTAWRLFQAGKNFPGLSPSLCVVATSRWPNPDRLTAVNPSQVVWPHDMPLPSSLSPAAPCTPSTPQVRA